MKSFVLLASLFALGVKAQETFPVSIIHFNDMHARFDETNLMSSTCKEADECIGGYARVVSKVKELLQTKADKNPIYLNAADNYQGTLWYNVYRWNVTSHFLNLFPADATVRKLTKIIFVTYNRMFRPSDYWQSRVRRWRRRSRALHGTKSRSDSNLERR